MNKDYFCPHHKCKLIEDSKLGYYWTGVKLCSNHDCHSSVSRIDDKINRFEFKFDDNVKLIYSNINNIISYICPIKQNIINLKMHLNINDFTIDELLAIKLKAEKMIKFL